MERLDLILTKFNQTDQALITKAFDMAQLAHIEQKRLSGEEYITHPLQVAYTIAEMGFDATTVAAGLLHDVVEDTPVSITEIEKQFGKDVAFLVNGVTKLSKVEYTNPTERKSRDVHFNSLKKMFFAMAEDLRVIMIKLADRLHNLQTMGHQDPASRQRIATETLEIYAPIAARLGMGSLKGQLEDLSFGHAYPTELAWLKRKLKFTYQERLDYIEKMKPRIVQLLHDAGIPVLDIHARAKHQYSLYQKLLKKDMDIDRIHDLVAIRLIVPDVKACYEALGVIHHTYTPLPGLIKDYISLPKPNGYQSLHTTIFGEKGQILEVQIRTPEMHEFAENGIAAHWAYSESGKKRNSKAASKELQWINQLKAFLKDTKTPETIASLKIDFFQHRIFVFTPKGEVEDLPEHATPIDFAYAIHTDLGHSLKGAKVNNRIVQLEHELKNGDVVEILKGKEKKPSRDWLSIAKTADARKKIRAWFHEKKEIVEAKPVKVAKRIKKAPAEPGRGIPLVQNQEGLLYKIAKCCDPRDPVKIRGYITLNRGISIHAANCSNLKTGRNARIIPATWKKLNQ